MSSGPDDWVQMWKHNALGFFDDPNSAWSVVAPDQRSDFRLYAYGLCPSDFSGGVERPFECSPLSCNHMAEEIETNAYCLLPELGDALALALTAESRRCEPGPYFVLEVWRQ